MSDFDKYMLVPRDDVTVRDLLDILASVGMEITADLYARAPDNVKRLFEPSTIDWSGGRN